MILSSSTCVGLRYELIYTIVAAFLVSVNSLASLLFSLPIITCLSKYVYFTPYPYSWFSHGSPSPWSSYPPASPPGLFVVYIRYWNIYQFPITYVFRPQLRPRLTLGGQTFPRKPWTFDRAVCICSLATHAGILSSILSTYPSGYASAYIDCSSTNVFTIHSLTSVHSLAPFIFGAPSLDQWAITHSFNVWLLLSQHPGCLCADTSFHT